MSSDEIIFHYSSIDSKLIGKNFDNIQILFFLFKDLLLFGYSQAVDTYLQVSYIFDLKKKKFSILNVMGCTS